MDTHSIPPIVIMGVQGSGKSTIGDLLARRLDLLFIDGDSLHSTDNKKWMASGRALSDAQRLPWLHVVGETLADGSANGIVVACSALKRSYRDLLREHTPALFTVFARGDMELIHARITARQHEYMPSSLLTTQFATLEEREDDELGTTVDIRLTPEQLVGLISDAIAEGVSVS
jgi:gluconokinase